MNHLLKWAAGLFQSPGTQYPLASNRLMRARWQDRATDAAANLTLKPRCVLVIKILGEVLNHCFAKLSIWWNECNGRRAEFFKPLIICKLIRSHSLNP
jgi:hypothetical protein